MPVEGELYWHGANDVLMWSTT
jgi:hypothetical protein